MATGYGALDAVKITWPIALRMVMQIIWKVKKTFSRQTQAYVSDLEEKGGQLLIREVSGPVGNVSNW